MLVSRGHNVFTKQDAKKTASSTSYKPLSDDELKAILQPELLSKAEQLADFGFPCPGFSPVAGLQFSQIDVADVQSHDGIWALSINDEGDKQVKGPVSRRLIPVHPTLIECGFLDYVQDASKHGSQVFPI